MNRNELTKIYSTIISSINDTSDSIRIERVATDLERYTYEPLFLFSVPDFLRMSKQELLSYISTLNSISDEEIKASGINIPGTPDTIIEHQLKMVLRNYQLLVRLRADEAEAWDEIHELYEDD